MNSPYDLYLAVKQAADDKLPWSVDHPYLHEVANMAGGGVLGGAAGTAAAIAAARAGAGPAAGVVLPIGIGLGAGAGELKAVVEHHRDAERYQERTGQELPFVVRHPYLTQKGMGVAAALPGALATAAGHPPIGAVLANAGGFGGWLGGLALHHAQKQELRQQYRQNA